MVRTSAHRPLSALYQQRRSSCHRPAANHAKREGSSAQKRVRSISSRSMDEGAPARGTICRGSDPQKKAFAPGRPMVGKVMPPCQGHNRESDRNELDLENKMAYIDEW